LRHAQAAVDLSANDGAEFGWSDFVARYRAGDARLSALVEETGRSLGVALAGLIAGFNVETLVIAGRVTQLGDLLLEAARAEARRRALPAMVDETDLRYSPLGTEMVLLGCSALVLQQELGII
jgi:predicted NBD/HSP70 family sugar kinase